MPRSAVIKRNCIVSPARSIEYGLPRFVDLLGLWGRGEQDEHFVDVGEMRLACVANIGTLNRHCHLFTVFHVVYFSLMMPSHVSWHPMGVLIRRVLFLYANSWLVAAILILENERIQFTFFLLYLVLNLLLLSFELRDFPVQQFIATFKRCELHIDVFR